MHDRVWTVGRALALGGLLVAAPARAQEAPAPEPARDAPAAADPAPTDTSAPEQTAPTAPSAPPGTVAEPVPEPPAPSGAATDPSQPSEGGKIDLSTEPPAPPVERTYHVHDGFYLRAGIGGGWMAASFDDDGAANLDLSGDAFGFGVDLMIGGSPSPGITLGGTIMTTNAFSMSLDDGDGNEVDSTSVGSVLIGPFFDAFPNSRKGWHLGAAVGVASMNGPDGLERTAGGGGAAWVGHDWWVAEDWSTGLMLRLHGIFTKDTQDDVDIRASSLGLTALVTVLYH